MPKIHCDNISCINNKKHFCAAQEEIEISNEGLCLSADDFTSLNEEEENFERESETD